MVSLLLICLFANPFEHRETVDVLELNHMYDCRGQPIFDQVIFWEIDAASGRLHVRAWLIADEDGKYPCMGADGLRCVRFRDGKLRRVVRGRTYRESWTGIDPEIANQRVLATSSRIGLATPPEVRE